MVALRIKQALLRIFILTSLASPGFQAALYEKTSWGLVFLHQMIFEGKTEKMPPSTDDVLPVFRGHVSDDGCIYSAIKRNWVTEKKLRHMSDTASGNDEPFANLKISHLVRWFTYFKMVMFYSYGTVYQRVSLMWANYNEFCKLNQLFTEFP